MKQTPLKHITRPLLLVFGLLLASFFILAKPTHAAFPGQNGRLLWNDISVTDLGSDQFDYSYILRDINLDGSDVRDIASATTQSHEDGEHTGSVSYSSDGTKIVYALKTPVDGTPNIYIANSDGSGKQQLTFFQQSDDKIALYPRFNMDGTEIIYNIATYTEEATLMQTYRINSNGTDNGAFVLSGSENCDMMPVYSPDGAKIAFYRHLASDPEGYLGVYIANSDGSNPQKIADSSTFMTCAPSLSHMSSGLDWSPDGAKLVYYELVMGEEVFASAIKTVLVNAPNTVTVVRDEQAQQDLAAGSVWLTSPQYTPDGRIVFKETNTFDDAGNAQIRAAISLMNDNGGGSVSIPGAVIEGPLNGNTEVFVRSLFTRGSLAVQPIPIPQEPEATNQAMLQSAETTQSILLQTPKDTSITCGNSLKESAQNKQDGNYDYPLGLVEFCFDTENHNNQVTLTFVTNLTPNQVKARKYNSANGTYFDIPHAIITQAIHQNQLALRLTYFIADNGELDLDPATGAIKDPVGLAVGEEQISLAGTGQALEPLLAAAVASSSFGFGSYLAYRQLRRYRI